MAQKTSKIPNGKFFARASFASMFSILYHVHGQADLVRRKHTTKADFAEDFIQ